jgi:hypothetical protein
MSDDDESMWKCWRCWILSAIAVVLLTGIFMAFYNSANR